MIQRGRRFRTAATGERNHHAVLREADVITIRRDLLATRNNKEIAIIYGVTHSTISLIRRGKSWIGVK